METESKEAVTNAITNQLNSRLTDPNSEHVEGDKKKKGNKKDLFGITNAIDIFATIALLKNKGIATLQRLEKILQKAGLNIDTNKYAKDAITNQRLQSAIAGAIRAPDRLFEAGFIETPACKHCGVEKATLDHTIDPGAYSGRVEANRGRMT